METEKVQKSAKKNNAKKNLETASENNKKTILSSDAKIDVSHNGNFSEQMETAKSANDKIVSHECLPCNFMCKSVWLYNRHLSTGKHIMRCKKSVSLNNPLPTPTDNNKFVCECGKEYMSKSGIWKHKQTCNVNVTTDNASPLITEIIKQNEEFKEMLLEQNKKNQELQQQMLELVSKPNTINNTTNNTKFNINVFLNEQCKDALNITDFINSLQIQLKDLENVGTLGYAEGISKIFINGLKEIDIYKRPIHCCDLKREVLYIKDKDSWEKENEEKTKIKNAIKQIEHKNIKNIPEWINQNPDSKYADSPKNEQYTKIISNSMGGSTDHEDEKNYNKIIKKVASQVVIEK
jgi:hypothetical protein